MRILFTALTLALLAGCAHTHVAVQKALPTAVQATYSHVLKRNVAVPDKASLTLESHLANQLAVISSNTSDARSLVVEVTITQYRMRNTALRVFTGVFSGKDYITSQVAVKDKTSGELIANFLVESRFSSSSKSSDNLLAIHSGMIVNYLKTGKS